MINMNFSLYRKKTPAFAFFSPVFLAYLLALGAQEPGKLIRFFAASIKLTIPNRVNSCAVFAELISI